MAKTKTPRRPALRLINHKIDERGESDLYKVGHEVVFEQGSKTDPSNLKMYVGWVSIGGLANQVSSGGEGSRFVVWQASPQDEEAEIHGVWINGGEPTADDIESFVKGSIEHLSKTRAEGN